MTISTVALAAKKVVEAQWLIGPAYDLATQAVEALESAQMLQSPELVTELSERAFAAAEAAVVELRREHEENARLRARITELEAQRQADHETWQHDLRTARGEREAAATRIAGLESKPDAITRRIAPTQALREDLHDGPLHHSYRTPRDMPELGGAR